MPKILKLIDIFPQIFTFTYKGKKNIKTRWGGIISIFAFFAILVNALLIGKDIYYKEKPNVIQIIKEEKYTPTFRINQNTTKIGFALVNENGDLDYESYIDVIPFYRILTLNKDKKHISRRYFLETENCKRSKGDSIYIQKCIKDMDFYLTGSFSEDSMAYFGVYFKKCSNKTRPNLISNIKSPQDEEIMNNFEKNINNFQPSEFIGNNEYNKGLKLFEYLKNQEKKRKQKDKICKSPQEINEFFNTQRIFLYIIYSHIASDPKNYRNPFTISNKIFYSAMGNDIKKEARMYFSNYVSESDNGIIFEEIKVDGNKLGVDSIVVDNFKDNSDLIFDLTFYMNNEAKLYLRSYIKLQEIFANLGGFINLIFLVCNLISFPYFQRIKNMKIISEFFELHDDIEIENEKKSFSNLNDIKIQIEMKKNKPVLGKDISNIPAPDNINNYNNNISNYNNNDFSINKIHEIINQDSFRNLENKNQERKEYEIINHLKGKKLFNKSEIVKSSYFCICCNNELKKKNQKYLQAEKNIFKGTDYLEMIKLNRDFKVLSYLLMNNIQQKTFDFLSNLKIGHERLYDLKDYKEIAENKDTIVTLKIMKKYYENENNLREIDKKLFELMNPKLKKLLEVI